MILFALGVLAGLLIATLIVTAIAYFRHPITQALSVAEKQLQINSPRPKGYVFDPPSEADEAREEIVRANDKKGKDTKLEDLI